MIEESERDCFNCRYRYNVCRPIVGYCDYYNKWEPKVHTPVPPGWAAATDVRDYNIGESDYSKHKIQPWDIWLEYNLNPWDADIIKRILRTKKGDDRSLDYQKIKHICDERLRQLAIK